MLHSFISALAAVLSAAALAQPAPDAPVAPRKPVDVSVHGDPRVDDYAWLRQQDDPDTLAYLHAEEAHTRAWLAPRAATTQTLYDEIMARLPKDDEAVPYRQGKHWYLQRTVAGQQYPIYVRRLGSPTGPEEVLLDLNALARGKPYLHLGQMAVSPDGRLLAYSLDETGALDHRLRIKRIADGTVLPWGVDDASSFAWASDSRSLFYVTRDATKRPHRAWRHVLGQPGPDTRVFEEQDARFWLDVGKTRDQAYLVLTTASLDTTESWVIPAHRPGTAARRVLARHPGREYGLGHRDGKFYLWVNDTGRNFRLVETSAHRPSLRTARELLPHRPRVMLEQVDVFAGHLVIRERDQGVQQLRVWDLATGRSHLIAFDEAVYSAAVVDTTPFDTTHLRLTYRSMVTPDTVIDYDLAQRSRQVLKRQWVSGLDPSRYESTQVMARAADGTEVPISLVYRKDLRRAGPQPLLLYGYGSYGDPLNVYFSSARLSLLDRGVVYAMAHVRGGGDLGRAWYEQGRRAHKMNTFTDFIACAETLIAQGFTEPNQLVLEGASAGGLLMGVVTNLRPDLFKAVVAEVPFVDVINTMLDDTLPLTAAEFLEWGNPRDPADYAVIRRYSPYDNLRATAYPALLVRASLHDALVPYWEPAKYVARMRHLKTDDRPLLLAVNFDAGHTGASGRYDAIRERAETFTFMLDQWGLLP